MKDIKELEKGFQTEADKTKFIVLILGVLNLKIEISNLTLKALKPDDSLVIDIEAQ